MKHKTFLIHFFQKIANRSPFIKKCIEQISNDGMIGQREGGSVEKESALIPQLIYVNQGSLPSLDKPTSQICTTNQIASYEYYYWMQQMKQKPRMHRKEWEWAYIAQVLVGEEKVQEGKIGLGFGCGLEPLPVLFTKLGSKVVVTDMDEDEAKDIGWVDTSQHTKNLQAMHHFNKDIGVEMGTFLQNASYKSVNMNNLPDDLGKYDYLWSSCAFEHLGSIQHGLDFVFNSCAFLKPGGIAVHTTEFNLSSNDETIESEHLSLYRKVDFERLGKRLKAINVSMDPLNLETGSEYPDLHIDLPPYKQDIHLRLAIGNFATTSIGIILRKQ